MYVPSSLSLPALNSYNSFKLFILYGTLNRSGFIRLELHNNHHYEPAGVSTIEVSDLTAGTYLGCLNSSLYNPKYVFVLCSIEITNSPA